MKTAKNKKSVKGGKVALKGKAFGKKMHSPKKTSTVPKRKTSAKTRRAGRKRAVNLVVVALLIVIFIKLAFFLGEHTSKIEEEPALAVRLNLEGDFPNTKEGTARFDMKLLMDRVISRFNKVPKYVIFAESKAIPGLALRYNVHDSVFEGGLPMMRSREVVFLDGNRHELVYTFQEGGAQKIYFDRMEIASGIFDPDRIGITGFAVSGIKEYNIETIEAEGIADFE
ncbi:hypothetical protein KY358_00900 [Candidatus Woesearchaeota archaeon]|nr:hypothetical protein [Candidatus Woesearchaeota archaeon]